MKLITPHQFFELLYGDSLGPGQLALRSIVRRSGKEATSWCYTSRQAARLAHLYRNTRDLSFAATLQDSDEVLRLARRRWPRATLHRVSASAQTATVLPALWAEIPIAAADPGASLPADPETARRLLAAVPRPPSVVALSAAGLQAFWLLDPPWRLATAEDRAAARHLVAKVQWAIRRQAASEGWEIAERGDLAHLLPLADTLEQAPDADRRRHGVADFELLPAPPPPDLTLPPWERPAAGGAAGEAPAADGSRVWHGCSWLRHCYHRRSTLGRRAWHAVLGIVGRCRVTDDGDPASDGRRLAHRFSAGHPGYVPYATDDRLAQVLRRGAASTCEHIAHHVGAWDEHCSRCPSWGTIPGPLALGRPPAGGATVEAAAARRPKPPSPAAAQDACETSPTPRLPADPGSAEPPPVGSYESWLEILRQTCFGPPPAATTRELARVAAVRRRKALALLLDGLEELLATLGGVATARQMVAALAAAENQDRFVVLRAALWQLFPRSRPGEVPTVRQLGYKLRGYRGCVVAGRSIERARTSAKGVTWTLRARSAEGDRR